PPSPRHLNLELAGALVSRVPDGIARVGLFVDADDATLDAVLARVPLDMLQIHGTESPGRAAEIRARAGKPVMKSVPVATAADLDAAGPFLDCVDRLLFDARPPSGDAGALPGGNARAFDWRLLAGRDWPLPWMLAGGLTAENLADAVGISGAQGVDVSSGVEDKPGHKDPERIAAFMAAAARL
ncbi:MAG: phosphoribosylanthranilate isomerase, partial [Alphaproteobacteria bacterium]